MQLCQRALGPRYMGDEQLRTAIINACRGVPELEYALMSPSNNCEQFFDQLRSSLEVNIARSSNIMLAEPNDNDGIFYVDRRYNDNRRLQSFNRGKSYVRGGQDETQTETMLKCMIVKDRP